MKNVRALIRYFRWNAPAELSPAALYHTPLLGEILPGGVYPVTNSTTAVQLAGHSQYEEVTKRDYDVWQRELAAEVAGDQDDTSSTEQE